MFDLFLALFGIPALAVKFSSESKKERAMDNMVLDANELTNRNRIAWQDRVTDKEIEERIVGEILSGKIKKYRKEVFAASKEIGLPGINNYFELCEQGFTTNYKIRETLARILMANRGKLLDSDAKSGIIVDFYNKMNEQQFEIEQKKRMAIWIDRQLKKFGINEQLLLDTHRDCYRVTVNNIERIRSAGTYKWYPMIHVAMRTNILDF